MLPAIAGMHLDSRMMDREIAKTPLVSRKVLQEIAKALLASKMIDRETAKPLLASKMMDQAIAKLPRPASRKATWNWLRQNLRMSHSRTLAIA